MIDVLKFINISYGVSACVKSLINILVSLCAERSKVFYIAEDKVVLFMYLEYWSWTSPEVSIPYTVL